MSPTLAIWGSVSIGSGSASGCRGGVSPGCGCSGSALGHGSPPGVAPGIGSPSPIGLGSSSPWPLAFLAFFFLGFGLATFFFGLGRFLFGGLLLLLLFLCRRPCLSPVPSPGPAAFRFLGLLTRSSQLILPLLLHGSFIRRDDSVA